MAFRRSISIDICCFFSLSLSLCIDLHLRLVRLTFFPPFLFRFYYIYTKNVCVPQLEKHLHQMRKNNWVSLSIQYLVCVCVCVCVCIYTCPRDAQEQLGFPLHPISGMYVHIYTYIYTHTHTYINIYIYVYMPTRCARTSGFPSPFNICYTHMCIYVKFNSASIQF
jgi:hypothetical protein